MSEHFKNICSMPDMVQKSLCLNCTITIQGSCVLVNITDVKVKLMKVTLLGCIG